jgi:hypothetical protein
MCDLEAGFTTVTGADGALEGILGSWHELIRPPFDGIAEPRRRSLGYYDSAYADGHCPAVLVIDHDPRLGSLVADRVNRAIRRHHAGVDVVTEPGYFFQPVGSPPAPSAASGGGGVSIDYANLSRVTVSAPAPAAGNQHRVAVIDTGDFGSGAAVTDFTASDEPQSVSPTDDNGHGSAVAELIRAHNPSAVTESLRVCSYGLAASTEMYLALIYAMWPTGRFDVVNVSMSSQLVNKCETQLGLTISAVGEWCKQAGGGLGPPLVAAIGNSPQCFGYPAAVDGAVVVEALDWSGSVASYNTPRPPGATTSQASGGEGTPGQSLGSYTVSGVTTEMVGSSFAAALVSAELAR